MDATLGERIRMHRARRKLSQYELGRLVHLSTNSISAMETGAVDPKASKLKAIAQVLGVSVDYLMGLTEKSTVAA
jgi:transcriptional regulator with XRE-family HTH domain